MFRKVGVYIQFTHYKKNLRLDGEDLELANIMLAVRQQTEDMREALVGGHVFESNLRF